MDRKIAVLRNLYYTAQEITLEGSTFSSIGKACAGIKENIHISDPPSYIFEQHYKKTFDSPFNESQNTFKSKDSVIDNRKLYFNNQLVALNPELNSCASSSDPYSQFKYEIQVGKWKLQNQKPIKKPYELLGLSEQYNYGEFREACRTYNLALHPDKHENSEEATQLFQICQEVISIVDAQATSSTNA